MSVSMRGCYAPDGWPVKRAADRKASILPACKDFRREEQLELAAIHHHLVPGLKWEVEEYKAGRRQFFQEPRLQALGALTDQVERECMDLRVVADQHDRNYVRAHAAERSQHFARARVVERIFVD